jgi:hypothetical protein
MFTEFDNEFLQQYAQRLKSEMVDDGFIDADEEPWNLEDALEHADSIEVHKSELKTYFKCAGCDFPHLSEQQAINCCPPVQVFACPQCDSYRYSEYEARECCR